jgi:hypothetical protein
MKICSIVFKITLFLLSWMIEIRVYGENKNDSTNFKRFNSGLGFSSSGYYIDIKGESNIYYYTVSVGPSLGYFINKHFEIGIRAEKRIQRTSFENQINESGLGAGYYFRYNIIQFDPFKTVFKKSPFQTHFIVEWEHLFANYRYVNQSELNSMFTHPRYIDKLNGLNQHHILPKVGLKSELLRNFYINLSLSYYAVNFKKIENPILGRITIEYKF